MIRLRSICRVVLEEGRAMKWGKIEIIVGDITQQKVDAIVNAANPTLLGGGGVDGAIHRAAGPELLEECRTLGGCPPGEARITRGYRLPAKWVIHTVGPIWRGGGAGEAETLARCYRNVLKLAVQPEYGIRTIAFPSISTGAYGFPVDQAARIAINEVDRFLAQGAPLDRVVFVCFNQETYRAYQDAAEELLE
jgi:O-acetyl-ADP-ribose deacetylase (regulator of RNase III)